MCDSSSTPYSLFQSFVAACACFSGIWVIYSKPRVSSGFGLMLFSVWMWVIGYEVVLPWIPGVTASRVLREFLSLVFAVSCVALIWKHADRAAFAVLFIAQTPLMYQLLSLLWSFEPADTWESAKLLLSLTGSLGLSALLLRYQNVTHVTIPWLIGSILVAGSCEYLMCGGSYFCGLEVCLLSPKYGWSSPTCRPFFLSWFLIFLGTLAWSSMSAADHGLESWITPQPMPVRARERILHPPTIPYRALLGSEREASKPARPRNQSFERMAGTMDTVNLI